MSKIRPDGIERPHPDRFGTDHPAYDDAMAAHRLAVAAGEPGYFDPVTGLFVMTASHLAGRPCCERGCRHCPWVDCAE